MTSAEAGTASRRLGELFPESGLPPGVADLSVGGIALDSRTVRPGELFAALPGSKADGAAFVKAAVERGAAAVLGAGRPADLDAAVPFVAAEDPRMAVAKAAARFYGPFPATLVAVTGTAGKTSVVQFTRQLWTLCGNRAAAIGTLGVSGPDGASHGGLTTPDAVALAKTLGALARAGVTHAALEASSHGLDQRRLDGIAFGAAAFTNIGRDHLDYHASEADYLDAKLRLFRELLPDAGIAVVADGVRGSQEVLAAASVRGLAIMTVGTGDSDLALVDQETRGLAQQVTLEWSGIQRRLLLPLAGEFQLCNAMIAAGLAIATDSDPEQVMEMLPHLQGVPGRLELVGETRAGAPVFVDYAHKPDALGAALDALRPLTDRRLIVVFGAGGDRDRGKRPLMGRIAAEKADVVIVTDDNPRSEDPAGIRAAIMAADRDAVEIAGREAAIAHAVGMLHKGDVLLIAGKGHETGQVVGDRTLPFDDREVARSALKETG